MGVAAIPLVMMAVATTLEVRSQLQAGKDAKRAADYNARSIEAEGAEARYRYATEAARTRATARAKAFASGVEMVGSPVEYLNEMQRIQEHELDWMETSTQSKAAAERWRGDVAKKAARNQAITSLFKGGAQMAGFAYGQGMFGKTTPPSTDYSLGSSTGRGTGIGGGSYGYGLNWARS